MKYRITSDPLTGVNNKIRLIEYLQYITQHQDPSKRLFILVMEVDFFKDIVRNFGYEMSDRVVAEHILKAVPAVGQHTGIADVL